MRRQINIYNKKNWSIEIKEINKKLYSLVQFMMMWQYMKIFIMNKLMIIVKESFILKKVYLK